MTKFTRDYFRKMGRKGGKRRAITSTPEQRAAWSRLGALKREENRKKRQEKDDAR